MIVEYDIEPIRGLPGNLPAGEKILWQGSPNALRMAIHAFHVRAIAIYFALLAGLGVIQAARGAGTWIGCAITLGVGLLALAVVSLIAWGSARTTVYTLTNRRIVMRFGIALPKCINLPLGVIAAADLSKQGKDIGDIALRLTEKQRLGWLQLWPHARPWALAEAQPMLRSIPEVENVAGLLVRTISAAQGTPANVKAPVLAVAA